ncbi:hypothetical protein Vadar_021283 [Vaccinium darrowii]|uniref:Uncharacterized protein n=1 Tax=Vaccinium darrowii TaxID=229202 RepID=A0ACB7XSW9_9ERIC|nr:hypothetical protein Vadar_021283 [Vaccinium darrowii]
MANEEVAADQGFYSPVIDFSMGGDIGADKEFSASHGTPQSAAPTTSGKKRKRADDEISKGLTNIVKIIGDFFKDSKTSMAETAYRIGYAPDLSITGRQVKHALKALPLETGKKGF